MSLSARNGGRKDADVNFASISSLDSSGGWHVLRLAPDGVVTADAAARKVLQQFFGDAANWPGGLPPPLAEAFFESRDWGLSRSLSRSWRSFTAIQSGLKLTANFVPDPEGGYVILKAGPMANAVAVSGLPLTLREQEIVALVAAGKTNAEIGIILSISARTVQKHLENIFRRLGVETRMALVARATA
jgi:DNA-binding CsgD family transcriptional regulator